MNSFCWHFIIHYFVYFVSLFEKLMKIEILKKYVGIYVCIRVSLFLSLATNNLIISNKVRVRKMIYYEGTYRFSFMFANSFWRILLVFETLGMMIRFNTRDTQKNHTVPTK